jgi:putative oxidoreductase
MRIDLGLLVLRVGIGALMIGHGAGKVTDLLSGEAAFPDPIGLGPVPSLALAAFAEFLCALLVVAGLLTRWAAVPVLINMLVAALIFHASDPFAEKEHALLFAIPFLALVFTGAGRYSLDGWLARRRR